MLYRTLRCSLDTNAILSMIDSAIGTFGNSRVEVAAAIFAAAMEEPTLAWFEDADVIAVRLPEQYVLLATNQGYNYEQIIEDCVKRGLRWLEDSSA